jgi:hypothetical protein
MITIISTLLSPSGDGAEALPESACSEPQKTENKQSTAKKVFLEIAQSLIISPSARNRVACFEIDGCYLCGYPALCFDDKAFAILFNNAMVFYLNEEQYRAVMSLPKTRLWDPTGMKTPIREWVEVPFEYHEYWYGLAKASLRYAREQGLAGGGGAASTPKKTP